MELSETLEELEKGNRLRQRARGLHRAGVNALSAVTDLETLGETWYSSGDLIETALLVQVHNKWRPECAPDALLEPLLGLRVQDVVPSPARVANQSPIPIFTATRALQALVGTSKHAFSRASLVCYYSILRELYTAQAPDWSTGGARAGFGAESTAFVTGDCMRSLFAFARIQWRTARFFTATADLSRELRKHEKWSAHSVMKPWLSTETFRLALAWYTEVSTHMSGLSLQVDKITDEDLENPQRYLDNLPDVLRTEIRRVHGEFEEAKIQIERYRKSEQGFQSIRRLYQSETAHLIAFDAVETAIHEAKQALETLEDLGSDEEWLRTLARQFERIDREVTRIGEPGTRFVASVLDRELSSAAAGEEARIPWAPRELAFAASAYGYATGWRPDERLDRASQLLADTIDAKGLLPADRPFYTESTGYRLDSVGFEVVRSVAQILQRTPTDISPTLARRLLQQFEERCVHLREDGSSEPCEMGARQETALSKDSRMAWRPEHAPVPPRPVLWASAIALQALHRVIRMMDSRINRAILQHFSVKRPEDSQGPDLRLNTLLYGDYGFPYAPSGLRRRLKINGSIALHLEIMRAHILDVELPEKLLQGRQLDPKVFSLVLYGPPGTGKTTLVEALARTCEVPLVEISPSDIAQSGEEGIEKRAREIFMALSMLSRSVILFDEFEAILSPRETARRERPSLFKLLTPGMLPKLTKLYEAAKVQQTAYCLLTNHKEQIDEAAIRAGRFDLHFPILRPDPTSRGGAIARRLLGDHPSISRELLNRLLLVVALSREMPMSRLWKEWLLRPPAPGSKNEPTVGSFLLGMAPLEEVQVLVDAQDRWTASTKPAPRPKGADSDLPTQEQGLLAAFQAAGDRLADRFLGTVPGGSGTAELEQWQNSLEEALTSEFRRRRGPRPGELERLLNNHLPASPEAS